MGVEALEIARLTLSGCNLGSGMTKLLNEKIIIGYKLPARDATLSS